MTPPEQGAPNVGRRPYGPDVGEPPPFVDPRRGGSLVGLLGGMVFVGSYAPALGPVATAVAWTAGLAGVLLALVAHYVRPVRLGPLVRPSRVALATYLACVVAEVVLIAVGSAALADAGRTALRPALVATVVGLHFLPFAWAFRERMFHLLGGAVAGLGLAGLLLGAAGVRRAAEVAAVLSGLVMIALVLRYARGGFAPASPSTP
ncbi:hypothetical protein [Cellulomonas endophytica]|uniref:hypothetical protein n=1 Tax=Cellulomonas endophytica TaxID=2494735 RepID=UPI0010101D88|nr:hypothetical protein [Cellulomonas endophytica]